MSRKIETLVGIKRLRPSLTRLVGKHDLVGAEIGTFEGINALNMFICLDIKKLYIIDPYEGPYKCGDDLFYLPQFIKDLAHYRLEEFDDRVVWLEMKSDEASMHVIDSLDFIYIDGDHTYNGVMNDLKNFYPKMKPNSIMCGHDFEPGAYDPKNKLPSSGNGVKEAIHDFFSDVVSHEISVMFKADPTDYRTYDWWVVL